MAKQSEEMKKNIIGSKNSGANNAGDMLVGRKRSIDLEADSANLRSLYTRVFISVPIFIGVATVLISTLFSNPDQSAVDITPKKEISLLRLGSR